MAKKIAKGEVSKREILSFSKEAGKTAKKIWEPSRGGTGIKLKSPRTRFNQQKMLKKINKPGLVRGKNRINKPTNNASKKLERGPAKPTRAGPHF